MLKGRKRIISGNIRKMKSLVRFDPTGGAKDGLPQMKKGARAIKRVSLCLL